MMIFGVIRLKTIFTVSFITTICDVDHIVRFCILLSAEQKSKGLNIFYNMVNWLHIIFVGIEISDY
jgi:hypothetical protein